MALSALDDRSSEPTGGDVAAVVGDSFALWRMLCGWLGDAAGIDGWQWGFSGAKYGWGLRANRGKRVIAYLIPQNGGFLVGLVLGDRTVTAAAAASLPQEVRDIMAAAPGFAEGTGFRLPVTSAADLDGVRTLVRIKLAGGKAL